MSELPTTDELLGPIQTPDEILGPKKEYWTMDGQHFDEEFMQGGAGKILDYFGAGVKQGWGQRPLGDYAEKSWVKEARQMGLFNDIDKHEKNWVKQFNESLLRGTAGALDFSMRAPMALYYGLANVGVETGVIPRDVAALVEAFPAGHLTGLPIRPRPSMQMLEDARRLDVLGEGTAEEARAAFAPLGEERLTERVVERPAPEAIPEESFITMGPQDIHTQARMIAPDTFKQYDALAEQKTELWNWLQEQKAERDAPLQARIDDILGKVNNVESRLTGRAALRLELARKELEEAQSVDTPAMVAARRALMETDFKMRDLAPNVSEAYREAQRQMPVEAVERVVAPAREAEIIPFEPARVITEPVANIVELAQRRPTIARDVERQLVEAGRPADEARAASALVQAHYEARAARFGGALGRARDLYEAEAPAIVGETGAVRRGALNLARNEIRLFKDADASTFLHETGHSWLEELRKDADHPAASADLKADLQTVRNWLGAEGAFTRAQHEKFARGFERYLMEGQAPSSRLAQVFEKFKNWLAQIYQTVSRLRAPITDEIRGVYDRLLATPSKEPVIIPEREGALDFATHAEETARATPATEARPVADQVLADRERAGLNLGKAFDDARREARRGTQRVVLPERENAGGESAAAGPRVVTADAALDARRNPSTGKSEPPRSASEPFSSVDGPLVDKAGNIRVDNLNVGDDVSAAIRQAAEESGGFAEARRGTLRDDEVLKLADDLGMSPNKLDRRRIGEAFNAEEIIQARRLLVQSATQVRDAMVQAAVGDEKGLIEYAVARERHLMIQEQVAGVTAEAGRALRAFRALGDEVADAKGLGEFFQRNLGKTPEALQREAQMGLRLTDPAQMNKYLRNQVAPGWKNMVMEGWLSSLLSGPMTHLRNIIGNTTVAFGSIVETGGAAAVSRLLRHEHGREFAEVGDRLWGIGQGSVDGIKAFGKAIVDEVYAFERTGSDDRAFRRAIPDVNLAGINVPLGQGIRLPLRLLAAEDKFFQAVAFQQELNVLARRSARLEGLTGSALDIRTAELLIDPTLEMRAGATKYAEYQTFTNLLGPQGRAVQQWADAHPFARFIFPFIRTPTNIVKYAGERTPFGLASQRIRDELFGRYGEARQADAIARMAIGTMTMTAVGVLAFNDMIFGGRSPRPEQVENDRQAGIIPYSIRIGNTLVSYRGVDPLSFPLAIATDIAEIAKGVSKDDPEYNKLVAMAMVNLIGHDFTEKLPLRTLASAILAIQDWEQYGGRFMNQMAGSFVPGIVAQTAQILDPVQREARSLADALLVRAGAGGRVPPRRDTWGEPILRMDVGPVQVSAVNQDPVRVEVARLGMGLGRADHKMDNVDLTPQQYDDYVRISGRFTKAQLDDMIGQPWYKAMPDGMKRQLIHRKIEGGRKLAVAQVKMESLGTDNDIVAKGIEEKLKVLK